ncbi:hypothetical protein LX16_0263 [Stackebrandtia albiflava]|uniref:DUF3558 domain-containing protein n=1 Tax=Stackebrandtia albiflava TaxID=406432 RepID=A0A562V9Q5_9ACTN|nr:hypothetical protein [Stackebrandtia albiflava]TWJ14578.1 hypothetical protein LX16_0263 [Stackebrandtia albiflava]
MTWRMPGRSWIAVAALISVSGCATGGTDGSASDDAASTPADAVSSSPPAPVTLESIAADCPTPVAQSQAAPYEGDAPHPYVVGDLGGPSYSGVPGLATSVAELQLVVCITDRSLDEVVGQCEYSGDITVDYVAVEVGVSIHVARTAREVADAEVVGREYDCPTVAYGVSDGDREDASVDAADVEAVIAEYVNGPA